MRAVGSELLDLLVPVRCRGCGRPGRHCCPDCVRALCGSPRRVRPSPEPAGLPEVWSAATYDDPVRRLLVQHKDRGGWPLSQVLGDAAARSALAALRSHGLASRSWLVVPMPSSAQAVRARGYDHADRLAARAAGTLAASGVPARSRPVLRSRRPVADQAGLGADQRMANLRGALAVDRPLTGARVLVVDDVMTTGASLAEAARALRAAGAGLVLAAVVARTERLHQAIT